MASGFQYFSIYKPYGVLSQFTPDHPGQLTLASLYPFPSDVYPVGRLDRDSEGLLLLTNDNALKTRLLSPEKKVAKTYWIQVEGQPVEADLAKLSQGMEIRVKKKQVSLMPAEACLLADPDLPPRTPPIRVRKEVPDQWVEIRIKEGKNRQVRRMMAAIGFPVLRLVRTGIGGLSLGTVQPGEVTEWMSSDLLHHLGV